MKDIWKSIAIAMISIIATLIGFWLFIGRDMITRSEASVMMSNNPNFVTRSEITELIEEKSLYSRDRSHIMSSLQDAKNVNEKLTNAINGLTKELAQLRAINEMLLDGRTKNVQPVK